MKKEIKVIRPELRLTHTLNLEFISWYNILDGSNRIQGCATYICQVKLALRAK